MTTPAVIARLAAEILGGTWTAETDPSAADGRLSAPGTDTFVVHVDDYGLLRLEADFGGEITRFPRPTTEDAPEPTARAVAEAIRQHLAKDEDDEQGAALYQRLNREGHFSGADYSDPLMPFHPNVTIAGATCSFYIDDAGVALLSLRVDGLTAIGTRIWGEKGVPLQIALDGGVVFATTSTWVIQFQHPEDGGDDCVWEYRIPAEEAPTEAAARTVATGRLAAALKTHNNTEAWNGITIRSARFTP